MSFESSTALQIDALLLWINSIGGDAEQIEDLASGETVADLLGQIVGEDLTSALQSNPQARWNTLLAKMNDVAFELFGKNPYKIGSKELAGRNETHLLRMLQLLLQLAVNCEAKSKFLEAIMGISEEYQGALAEIVQSGMDVAEKQDDFEEQSKEGSGGSEVRVKLQKAEQEKRKLEFRVEELEEELMEARRKAEELENARDRSSLSVAFDQDIKRDDRSGSFKESKERELYVQDLEQKYEERESEIKEMKERMTEIEQKSEDSVGKLQDDLALQKEEVMRLRGAEKELAFYRGKAEGVDGLREQKERLEETNERLRSEIQRMAVEGSNSSELTKAVEYLKEQLEKEQAKARTLGSSLEHRESELNVEKGERSRLEKEVGYLQGREQSLQDVVEDLRRQMEELESGGGGGKSALFSGQIATIELQEKLAMLQKENEALKMKGENALNAELVRVQQELEAERIERKRLQESSDLARARVRELESEADILQNQLNRLRGEEAKAGDLQTDFRSLRRERDAALDKLSKANSRLEELDSVNQELNVLKKEKMEHVEELKKILQEKGDFQDKLIALKEQQVASDAKSAGKDAEIAQLQRRNQELEGNVQKLQEEGVLAAKKQAIMEQGVKEDKAVAMLQLEKERDMMMAKTEISELKLKVREKDDEIALKGKEMDNMKQQLRLEKEKELREQETEFEAKEEDLLKKVQAKEIEVQRAKDGYKELRERQKREERLMMSAFHELALQFNQIRRNVAPETYIASERKRAVEAISRK